MIDYLQIWTPLSEKQLLEIEKRGVSLTEYSAEIIDLSCRGYSTEQIAHRIMKIIYN